MQIPNALKQFNELIEEIAKLDTENKLELIPHANVSGVYVIMAQGTNHGVQLWLDGQEMILDYMTRLGNKRIKATFDIKGLASRTYLYLNWQRQEI